MLRDVVVSRASLLGALAVCSCNDHPIKPVEYQAEIEVTRPLPLNVNRDVDVLFVIDNSRSMADEQKLLSQNFERFIAKLEHPDVKANYRIGVTTTDSGNPACFGSNGTTPEMGKLQMSSCRDRLGEFEADIGGEQIDETAACLDVCPRDGFEILPTLGSDGEKAPRRWLESIEGDKNVPEDWTTAEAFGCFGPQGIVGCGFESPLESMYRALKLSDDENSSSYGFVRPGAILAVVLVTDEVDCSHNPDHNDIFTDQNTEFRPEGANYATSAICWHAGVECTGDGSPFDECHSIDLDGTGTPVDAETASDDAVLYPVSRYVSFLRNIEKDKQKLRPNQEVVVSVIGGVPRGYPTGDDDLFYVGPQSESQAINFGVEPGCVGDGQDAYPPVRLREWAEAFQREEQRNLFSVCEDDYSAALEAVADDILRQLQPACFEQCVLDADAHAPGLQVGCEVTETDGGIVAEVPECERDDDGSYAREDDAFVVPDAANVCYVLRSDRGGASATDDPNDDMHEDCQTDGINLQFDAQRRRGVPEPPGSVLRASCQLSPAPAVECPGSDG